MRGKSKILVVDDQPGIRHLVAEVLEENDYEVTLAANGQEALSVMHKTKPEVVLLDMKMPDMNGLQVLQQMNSSGENIPVIMMTAFDEQNLIEQAEELGAKGFLAKPFDINQIIEAVSNICS
ncbi:response regulator [Bacillota bacterium LX-D]|nr:response regulator [Bacillota bacterium LX-D]